MQRGQVTIPIKIRQALNITPETWLKISTQQGRVIIQPVETQLNKQNLDENQQKKLQKLHQAAGIFSFSQDLSVAQMEELVSEQALVGEEES
jgi:bifunctional DNA-binding transcriptional regulator/antitoxin component of YhaV-PrlF toxin-antitoxin module